MKYSDSKFIFPPRPNLYDPDQLEFFDNGEYWAQLKLDDTRNLIIMEPSGEIKLFTRHKTAHKAYSKPHPNLIAALSALKLEKGKYQVFDSLLMHSKNALVKDTVVLMDMLVYNSDYLYLVEYEDRYDMLKKVCGNPKKLEKDSSLELALKVTEHLWLAKNYEKDFRKLFNKWEGVFKDGQRIVEGLVFKQKTGKLEYHFNSEKCSWMYKVRYPKKNYDF
jgi:hypothetical protein